MVGFNTRAGRLLAAGLAVSLAANLFLGGVLAGRWLAAPEPTIQALPSPTAEASGRSLVQRMARALGEADRTIFEDALRQRRGELAAAQDAVRAARRQVRAALLADPFDIALLTAALAGVRAANLAVQETFQGGLADAAERISPDGRRRLADWRTQRRSS